MKSSFKRFSVACLYHDRLANISVSCSDHCSCDRLIGSLHRNRTKDLFNWFISAFNEPQISSTALAFQLYKFQSWFVYLSRSLLRSMDRNCVTLVNLDFPFSSVNPIVIVSIQCGEKCLIKTFNVPRFDCFENIKSGLNFGKLLFVVSFSVILRT